MEHRPLMNDWEGALVEASRLLREQQPTRDTSHDFARLIALLRKPVAQSKRR